MNDAIRFFVVVRRAPYLDNMQCMLMPQTHKQRKIYISGYSGRFCEMDFDKKTLLRQVPLDAGDCILLKYCTFLELRSYCLFWFPF